MPDEDINSSDDREDEDKDEDKYEGGEMSADAGAQGSGGAQLPDPMTTITNAMQSDLASLMFVCIGFEVVTAHQFDFHWMMPGTNNLLRLDDKRVKIFVTVTCNPSRGVASVPVAKLV